ncbi:MAG: 30S ribosome-binding factor RbfA [Candidatus Moranbacteria bacterium]|nr:30S ribosome-binding factor RbfA [Candidatus Moranbacteria bacterium]
MKQRIKSANINLRDEIATIINKLNEDSNTLITVTSVNVSNDLKHMKVKISVMPEKKLVKTLKFLQKNVFAISDELSKKVKMKYIPKIKFILDKGYSNFVQVQDIISKLNEK